MFNIKHCFDNYNLPFRESNVSDKDFNKAKECKDDKDDKDCKDDDDNLNNNIKNNINNNIDNNINNCFSETHKLNTCYNGIICI